MDKIGLTTECQCNSRRPTGRDSAKRHSPRHASCHDARRQRRRHGKIAEWMRRSIDNRDNDDELAELRKEVVEFCHTLRDI